MTPKQTIEILTGMKDMLVTKRNAERTAALDDAIAYTSRWVPAKVVRDGQWSPVTCPNCGKSLSTHLGDGYYSENDWLRHCPNEECHQMLDWTR